MNINFSSGEMLFTQILEDEAVVKFVKQNLTLSYSLFFKSHENQIKEMINKSFQLLIDNYSKFNDKKSLQKTVEIIGRNIFHKNRPYFWFNRMYNEYKKYIRPRKDYERIKDYIIGKTVLDFGCGTGYIALELQNDGFNVLTTDVLDYRVREAKKLTFIKTENPKIIPYPDDIADTTIVKSVLHHIDNDNVVPVLKELRRLSRRLVIEEDVYYPSLNLKGLNYLRTIQPSLDHFLKLSKLQQYYAIALMDYFANAVAFGKLNINFPFTFRTVVQWRSVLYNAGFKITKIIFEGFEKDKVHPNCQVWLVCDRI